MKKVILLSCCWLMTSLVAFSQVNLSCQFVTGGDDLRGGNDNVNMIFLLRNGSLVRFDNINARGKWGNNSTQTINRTLAAPIQLADVVGVRIETTFSGGMGGDNWNLDRLTINATMGSTRRLLFDQSGKPLFRFTGDQRVREFRFSALPIPPAPPVMTRFNPTIHGFKFVNSFKNIFISEVNWTTSGLCGGMAYSALDYFKRSQPIPTQTYMPAEGTTLQSYLYNRQVNSIVNNIDKWGEYGFNPGGSRNREFFNWGIQMGSGRLGELQGRIDRGEPVPLGLQSCGGDCACPGGCPGSHQVLAIGYQLGRYAGDPAVNAEDVSIFVYDPNFPNRTMTLKPKPGGAWYEYAEDTRCRWRAYFVDLKYGPSVPPVIPAISNEITLKFVTGGDDLRGGNDNVHAIVILRSGRQIRFDNVNGGRRWIDNSSQTVGRSLPDGVSISEIAAIRLETTFGGGMGGDNWNLDEFTVTGIAGGVPRQLFTANGRPLFRFTGSAKTQEFRF